MDLAKKYNLTKNSIKNIKYAQDHFGSEFDIIYEGKHVPAKLVLSEFPLRAKRWQLIYNGGILRTHMHVFKISFDFDGTAYINNIRAIEGLHGSFLLDMLIELCKLMRVTKIYIHDGATIMCDDIQITLSYLKIITEGITFYGKHGFVPHPEFEQGVCGYTKSQDMINDILGFVREFRGVLLADYMKNIEGVLDVLTIHKEKTAIQTINYNAGTFQDIDLIHGELGPDGYQKALIKYGNLWSTANKSNRKYLYQHMLDMKETSCIDYADIEDVLFYNDQVYSFATPEKTKRKPKIVHRDYILPIMKAILIIRRSKYVLNLAKPEAFWPKIVVADDWSWVE